MEGRTIVDDVGTPVTKSHQIRRSESEENGQRHLYKRIVVDRNQLQETNLPFRKEDMRTHNKVDEHIDREKRKETIHREPNDQPR
jgi:hypothetical protein